MYAKDHPDIKSLEEVCETIKPSVAIGKNTFFAFSINFERTLL